MKKLLIFMKGFRKECFLGPLFKLFEATLELSVPLIIASLIDNGIVTGNTAHTVKMSAMLVIIALAGLAAAVTAQFFAAKAAVGFTAKVKEVLYERILNLSFSQKDKIGTSTLITRLTGDMNQVQTGVNLTLRLLLRSPFVVFGAMIMAFTVDFKSALIFAVVIPVLSVVVFGIMLINIPLYRKARGNIDKLTLRIRENLSGVRVIRAFCKEKSETESFRNENDRLTEVQLLLGRISALMNPVTFIIINIATVVLIHTGAVQVNTGILTQGAVVALYNYMSQILVELIKLADLIINITKSVACGKRISAVLQIEPEQHTEKSELSDSDCFIEFKNVSLAYNGSAENSLENISFKVNKGETVGIIGATGSGKSSLVNLIPRFYDATKGQIFIENQNINSIETVKLRNFIGTVPQKAVLFKGTVRSNMLMGNENATDAEITEALKAAEAFDFVFSDSKGLDRVIEQNGKNLSGGQRQRLTVARALLKKPEILILDDSSSALDFATDAALRSSIKNLSWKPTVFTVSQRTSSIMNADKIIVLDDGKCVGTGTHKELLEACDVYREIYYSQFKKEAYQNA